MKHAEETSDSAGKAVDILEKYEAEMKKIKELEAKKAAEAAGGKKEDAAEGDKKEGDAKAVQTNSNA